MDTIPPKIEFPLDLPGVRILKTELTSRDIIITVESTQEYAICHRCGGEAREFHSYSENIRLRHLPILERRVFIELRPKRYLCKSCDGNRTTTQKLDWYEARSPHTKAYEQSLLLGLVNSTVSDVARKQGLSAELVEGVMDRYIAGQVDWTQYSSLPVIGLDEIALKKGHKDYVVIVTTQQADGRIALLGVLENREKATVVEFLRSIPAALRSTIKEVCSDMYEGFINAVKEEVSQARVVIDRFHVARSYRENADQMRKQELRFLKKELREKEYDFLKGTMWPFRRNPEDLTKEQREDLALLLDWSPELSKTYELRQELTAIFETKQTKEEANEAINEWRERVKASGLSCYDKFLKTLSNWQDEITNYFINRRTSGFVEGLNNRIKVLKRRCYGITNVVHLFQRLFLDLEGYRLFAPIL